MSGRFLLFFFLFPFLVFQGSCLLLGMVYVKGSRIPFFSIVVLVNNLFQSQHFGAQGEKLVQIINCTVLYCARPKILSAFSPSF